MGGKAFPENQFFQPTVVEDPREQSQMMKEEIFGPILPILGYDDLNEVIRKINDRPKPLVVYCFSNNLKIRQRIKNQTSSGAYVVNDVAVQLMNNQFPFGGVGMSGYGRYHGKCGFDACCNPKSVMEAKIVDSFPNNQRFPPYTESKQVI